jgi:hypothetical protein
MVFMEMRLMKRKENDIIIEIYFSYIEIKKKIKK